MKRHNSLIPLSRNHYHGLIAAQFCKKNSPDYKRCPAIGEGSANILTYGKTELLDHFSVELKH